MADAPKVIWAWEYRGKSPWGEQKPDLSVVTNGAQYIRADAPELLALVMAARALAEWAEASRASGDCGDWDWQDGDAYSSTVAALAAYEALQ